MMRGKPFFFGFPEDVAGRGGSSCACALFFFSANVISPEEGGGLKRRIVGNTGGIREEGAVFS